MLSVNKQMALFFKDVGMRNYLKNTITVFVAVFSIIIICWSVLRIANYYTRIGKIEYHLSGWLYLIINFSAYLALTGIFYLLADFGFDAGTYRFRTAEREKILNNHFNFNIALNSARQSVFDEQMLD